MHQLHLTSDYPPLSWWIQTAIKAKTWPVNSSRPDNSGEYQDHTVGGMLQLRDPATLDHLPWPAVWPSCGWPCDLLKFLRSSKYRHVWSCIIPNIYCVVPFRHLCDPFVKLGETFLESSPLQSEPGAITLVLSGDIICKTPPYLQPNIICNGTLFALTSGDAQTCGFSTCA